MRSIFFLLSLGLLSGACRQQQPAKEAGGDNSRAQPVALHFERAAQSLSDYWYQGKGEINHYELLQNRYREVHPGEVVLIFVTEDFLADKQVKNESYTRPNSVPVLKTNLNKEFNTGLYTYRIMTSVFTPVDAAAHPATLKVTNSAHDWCGQAFMQTNFREGKYQTQVRSYFENEGDQDFAVEAAVLEDELFNRIRLNPDALPQGKIRMLPGMEYVRLGHHPFEVLDAEAGLQTYTGSEFEGKDLRVYTVRYPALDRTLEIVFEGTAPYLIAGWKDTFPGMFDRQLRSTVARRTHTILDSYWQRNSVADTSRRASLGLE